MDYANEIRNFIVSNFLYGDDRALTDETSFLESGIIDSTGILELIMFIETTCGIKLQHQEILPENLDSLKRIVQFVDRKRAAVPQSVA